MDRVAHQGQDLGQALPFHELHRVVVHAVLLTGRIDTDDVRMLQCRGGVGLTGEPLERVGVEHGGKWQHLQGNVPLQRKLFGLVNDPHAAATNFANQPIVSQGSLPRVAQIGRFEAPARLFHAAQALQAFAESIGDAGVPL